MKAKKLKTAKYHLHTRVLKSLDVGDQVRVKPLRPNEKAWQQAMVSEKLDARNCDWQWNTAGPSKETPAQGNSEYMTY